MNSSPLTAVSSLLHAHSPISLQVFPLLSLLQPFFIFQGQCCYYTELDQVTIALCCLTASSLFPTHPIVVVLVTQLCPTLCDIMDYSTPGSSVHGIFQAGILRWVTISSSRLSSQPRDQTHLSYVSCIGRQVLYY